MTLRVVGDDRVLALAAAAEAATVLPTPRIARPEQDGAATVHLGEPAEPLGPDDIVWRAGSVETAAGEVWSHAPFPAADALFELPLPSEPRALVVGDDAERRAMVVDALRARGGAVGEADELAAEALAAVSVVALLGAADAPRPAAPWEATTMPAEAPAVLAARRILIAPRCATTFGFLPGMDHLAFSTHDDVVHYADAALSFPESFEPFRVLGALAAERHRASVVYARLGADAAITSSPRSAEPRG